MPELFSVVNKSGNRPLCIFTLNEQCRTRLGCTFYVVCSFTVSVFSEAYRTLIDDGFLAKKDPTELRINFEQFCALATESAWRVKSNGVSCESEIPSVWSILCRKASKFLRRAIVQPFNRFLGISYSQKFPTICSSVYIVSTYELASRSLRDVLWLIVHENVHEQSSVRFVRPFNFLDWTNFFVPESEKRDLYVGVIGKDQFWLETTAIPSIEWAFEM